VARSIFYYTDSQLFGGAEQALLLLIETLDRDVWQPTLLLGESEVTPLLTERAAELDVPARTISATPLGMTGARRVPAIVQVLRNERPDVFHAHLPVPLSAKYPLAAAILARVPAVLATVQLVGPFKIDRSNMLQLRLLAAGVDRYLAVSQDIKQELVRRLQWPAQKIEVVYNAVRLDRFDPNRADRDLPGDLAGKRKRPVVLTVARLDEQKGHPVLLRAAAQLPDVLFLLAGEGPNRESLEQLARTLGVADRVVFLGHRSDVPELLRACDVFALPSLYEGSSLATLEAMASGSAVVSSAIPGTDELISDGESGLLVPPNDPAALAGALRRVLGDAELRAELGRQARARVERDFTAEAMTRKVVAVYDELLRYGRRR
jgi:glycosyltransferase involved in cell wall biosynthesis